MSTSCGFFNSRNGDRKYDATHFGHCFDGIILDGVLSSVGSGFNVSAADGMTIHVGSGKAWYLGSWLENDSALPITLEQSDVVMDRIDAVVMEFDISVDVRWNEIKVVKGEASDTPERPALSKTEAVVQIPLAYVLVKANTSSITEADITNVVGTSDCPYSANPITSIHKFANATCSADTLSLRRGQITPLTLDTWRIKSDESFAFEGGGIKLPASGTVLVFGDVYFATSRPDNIEAIGPYVMLNGEEVCGNVIASVMYTKVCLSPAIVRVTAGDVLTLCGRNVTQNGSCNPQNSTLSVIYLDG